MVLSACGDTSDDAQFASHIPFTPVPKATPVPKLCGNGTVDAGFEECDIAGPNTCAGGTSCVCCVCLGPTDTLGDRTFRVARPPSQFLSSALGLADVAVAGIPWDVQEFTLRAGRPNPGLNLERPEQGEESACQAAITAEAPEGADGAILGFRNPIGTVCVKVFTDTAKGFIDCDGGSGEDVEYSVDSNGAGENSPPEITTGLGDPAGPGSLTLEFGRLVMVNVPLPPGAPGATTPPYDCTTVDYDDPLSTPGVKQTDVVDGPVGFTTTKSRGIVLNPRGGGPTLDFSVASDRAFSCVDWTNEAGSGRLVGAVAGLDAPVVGDTMNFFLWSGSQ
ncbi:MAG: hypothetical protein A2W29_06695 [Gemmatimonadetes bacterium RBG_16_66_8]|nr:MAG: hypothetical protein A2W29_06695 [Gemmatimonadetes bacterium RBG_16_66_8]